MCPSVWQSVLKTFIHEQQCLQYRLKIAMLPAALSYQVMMQKAMPSKEQHAKLRRVAMLLAAEVQEALPQCNSVCNTAGGTDAQRFDKHQPPQMAIL